MPGVQAQDVALGDAASPCRPAGPAPSAGVLSSQCSDLVEEASRVARVQIALVDLRDLERDVGLASCASGPRARAARASAASCRDGDLAERVERLDDAVRLPRKTADRSETLEIVIRGSWSTAPAVPGTTVAFIEGPIPAVKVTIGQRAESTWRRCASITASSARAAAICGFCARAALHGASPIQRSRARRAERPGPTRGEVGQFGAQASWRLFLSFLRCGRRGAFGGGVVGAPGRPAGCQRHRTRTC